MNAVQVEQNSYEMPPREGFTVAHFLTVADVDRSARFYEKVFGGRVLSRGDSEGAPAYIQIANTWLLVNVGGGPTPDKPTVTPVSYTHLDVYKRQSLDRAQAVIHAAVAEAKKRDWKMNVAVVDSGGNLVAFQRMDGAMLASIQIAQHKARAAATFRRETKQFEDGIQPVSYTHLDVYKRQGLLECQLRP